MLQLFFSPSFLPGHAQGPAVLATAPMGEPRVFFGDRRRPIVAIVDGSEAALNAAWRAALIAQNWGVPVHVLNARPSSVEGASLLVTHVENGCRPSEWFLGSRA